MYSVRIFNQCDVLSLCLVFQFLSVVFLAVVMAISIGLVLLGAGLITVRSPSKQSEVDNGRMHPNRSDIFSMTPSQKVCTGGPELHGMIVIVCSV